MKKRIYIKPGAIFEISLENSYYTYARALKDNAYAFYAVRYKQPEKNLTTIVSSPILFVTLVYKDSVKEHWQKIGFLRLEPTLLELPPMFSQDALQPNRFEIHYDDGTIKKANKVEVIGLERFAAWEAWAIAERLNDHFAGRKNQEVEEMRNPDLYLKNAKTYPERVKKLIEEANT
ncbi:MAG: immunity 26/phosphotriesterase HocA family protein [Spirochaetota bacterium]